MGIFDLVAGFVDSRIISRVLFAGTFFITISKGRINIWPITSTGKSKKRWKSPLAR